MQTNYVDTDRTSAVRLADLSRTEISAGADTRVRGELGQFMTPAPVAIFMAGLFSALPRDVRLLDAGAGVGMLTAAFVERACSVKDRPATISVTAFEVDERLAKHLKVTLDACGRHCKDANIEFNYRIIIDDYILYSAEPLMSKEAQDFNFAILNPPYAKINSKSKARAALSKMGIETSNLYTAFLALSIMQVCNGGQIVAITPRSFCNGLYFAPFRRLLLSRSALERVHLYESRKKAFEGDDVLQENIIFKLVIREKQPEVVILSSSLGPEDERPTMRSVPIGEVVQSGDPHFYIHLPVSIEDGNLAERVRTLPCTLRELGITVSTGRVVDFRARDHLRKEPEAGAVPLIYPAHFEHGYVVWPRPNGRKHNALAFNMETTDLVVPRGTYVLTKRFTSKEEKRRLVAVVYDPARIDAEHVGFENHLNYFHVGGKGLRPDFARGLAVFLNSSAVDQYFRQFSGHTQVNATDLRQLHYPTREQLAELGRLYGSVLSPQKAIDEAVEALIS
jgi:adenine-specific DNA-methyltransferase